MVHGSNKDSYLQNFPRLAAFNGAAYGSQLREIMVTTILLSNNYIAVQSDQHWSGVNLNWPPVCQLCFGNVNSEHNKNILRSVVLSCNPACLISIDW